jgi:hypothetical protein
MAQYYNPDFDRMLQGKSIETDDAEILSAVRRVMTEENVAHPEVIREAKEAPQPVSQVRKTVNQTAGLAVAAQKKTFGYRPRWSHNLAILMLAAFVYSPAGTSLAVALTVGGLLVLYWLLGADRSAACLKAVFRGYARISPSGAEALTNWGNRCSARAQKLADRLPERWTQGLYLPVFGEEADPDLEEVEPFERLLQKLNDERSRQGA